MPDLQNTKKIYFVGIGGIAMSAAANLAKAAGFEVAGSDSKDVYSPAKDVLDENEIEYHLGYEARHINHNPADVYVLSAGEGLENPEVKYLVEKNWPRMGLAQFLYELSRDVLRVVVTGTHGKSTTTGLLGHLLKNLDGSSFMAGAVLQNYNQNFYWGNGHYFVFEGDEYKEQFDDPTPKFHYYKPDILVLTNLEYDHPDMFESFESLEQEFRQLIANLPEDGLIVYNADDAHLTKLAHESNVSSVSFAIENEADFKGENIQYGEYTSFEVSNRFARSLSAHLGYQTEKYKIQLPGKLNVYNALAVVASLRALGFQPEQIALDLLTYSGIKRRFEVVGIKNGITIVDDYAHHPTAVRETLATARLRFFSPPKTEGVPPSLSREGGGMDKRLRIKHGSVLWAVFEPHTFSRTKATLSDLSKAFDAADQVLISEIYPAREKISDASITSQQVVDAIHGAGPSPLARGDALSASDGQRGRSGIDHQVRLIKNKLQALTILKTEAQPGDVILVMAVGNFNRLAYELKESL